MSLLGRKLMEEKQQIRAEMLPKRMALSPQERQAAADSFNAEFLRSLPENSVVAGYWPINGELDLRPLMQRLAGAGHSIALPVVVAGDRKLQFRLWRQQDLLEKGSHGVSHPTADKPLVQPDYLLVPLVACDGLGNRLGYGGGYYDETILTLREQNTALQVIGCAYAFQKCESLPTEPHDQRLNALFVV